MIRANVLTFHDIAPDPRTHSCTAPTLLQRCVALLADGTIDVRTVGGLDAPGGKAVAALTFDDGWRSDHDVALPILVDHNLVATFFIVTDEVGRPGCLSWPQVLELRSAGMEIGSHTCSHPFLTDLSDGAVRDELLRSKESIEARLGEPVKSLSLPHGYGGRRVLRIAMECGYGAVCSSQPGMNRVPVAGDSLIRRNSFHRGVAPGELESWIRPTRGRLVRDRVGYHVCAAAKRLFGRSGYTRLRNVVLGTPTS